MSKPDTLVQTWLGEQAEQHRQLVLIVNGLTQPPTLARLFAAAPLQAYRNVFQHTAFKSLSEHGHWLVHVDSRHLEVMHDLLANPEPNWGWLASTVVLDIDALADHWRQRLLFQQDGQRWLYRFEDNRVMARHLAALAPEQRPLLLGPLNSALCWDGKSWQRFDNPRPGHYERRQGSPWLDVPEPVPQAAIQEWEKWLWEHHPSATAHLLQRQPLADWLNAQLALAEQWRWTGTEQLTFLLEHRLDPGCAEHEQWQPQTGETARGHFDRCKRLAGQWGAAGW